MPNPKYKVREVKNGWEVEVDAQVGDYTVTSTPCFISKELAETKLQAVHVYKKMMDGAYEKVGLGNPLYPSSPSD